MKTFNKEDIIAWTNRDKAEIGKEYYFADSLKGLQNRINENASATLGKIDENEIKMPFYKFEDEYNFSFACILPVECVLVDSYREIRSVRDLFGLLFDPDLDHEDDFYIEHLLLSTVRMRHKKSNAILNCIITEIREYKDELLICLGSAYYEPKHLLNDFEIEIKGKWVPFGING